METNEIYPLGTDTPHQADVRYIAATHKDLRDMVERGEFRRDLFGRLAGITVRIPPLRDRPEDIEEIGMGFVQSYSASNLESAGTAVIRKWLRSAHARNYYWPGNVRELQNALRNLLLGLPPGLEQVPPHQGEGKGVPPSIARGESSLESVEQWYIGKVLGDAQGNLTQAAHALGVNRSTLRRRLQRQKSSFGLR